MEVCLRAQNSKNTEHDSVCGKERGFGVRKERGNSPELRGEKRESNILQQGGCQESLLGRKGYCQSEGKAVDMS